MGNFIITKDQDFFQKIGDYNYCNLEDMILPDTIALDTETTSLKPILGDIFAIQLGTGENNYLIHCYDNNYEPKDVFKYLEGRTLVGHNITFDLKWLYKYGFYPKKVKDTFIASKILYNGFPPSFRHGFGYVFEREMDIIYDKSEQKNIHNVKLSTKASINYCFQDVDRLLELHDVLEQKLIDSKALDAYNLHCKYIKGLAYMEHCGAPINIDKWKEKIIKDIKYQKECENIVLEYIFDHLPKFRDNQIDMFDIAKRLTISLTSSKQMIPVFKELGIDILTDEKKESIGEDILSKSKHEFVKIWLDFQKATHDVTTFGQNILDKVIEGRIYSSFNPILDTARISTSRGDINTLNLPANQRTRECIEAKEGFQMIVSDYEGQETRTGADITGDKVMIASIVNGLDLHCAFARLLYPEELQELSDEDIMTNHKAKRNASKAPRFCFQFGGTGYTLALNEGLSLEEGQRIEGLYKELHPGIYEYGNSKIKEACKLGYIESVYGFKLHLPFFNEFKELETKIQAITKDDWDLYKIGKKEYREQFRKKELKEDYVVINQQAYNFYKNNKSNISKYFKLKSQYFRLVLNNPTQTTAAFQTKLSIANLFEYIVENNHQNLVKLCIAPHDEIVLESIDSLCEHYQQKLGEIMKESGNVFIKNPLIKMEASANVGKNWYLAK
jgi:DNA polymerase-1